MNLSGVNSKIISESQCKVQGDCWVSKESYITPNSNNEGAVQKQGIELAPI